MSLNLEQIKELSCSPVQKDILAVLYRYDEGWLSEDDLESELRKIFSRK